MIDISKSPHRVAITSACDIITVSLFISVFYFIIPVPWWKELCTELLFPTIAAIAGGLAVIWAGEASVKTLLRLRERINRGLKDRKIVIIGNKDERENIETQLKYSNLFAMENITNADSYTDNDYEKYDLVILALTGKDFDLLDKDQSEILQSTLQIVGNPSTTKQLIEEDKPVVGLIILCPVNSLKGENATTFRRPFTAVVNQPGRMITDIFSLLTTLPITKG